MRTVLQDIRFAVRTLSKNPAFSFLSVITIALGIGASTAAFSMLNGVLLRRLPYGGGTRLVHVLQPTATSPDAAFAVLQVDDYRKAAASFAAVSEYHSMAFQLFGRGDPKRVQTGVVSDNYFQMLGVHPLLGRLFAPGEDAIGAPPVVLLSYRYWRDELASDPGIVGAKFTMNDKVHTVIGVLPPLPSYPDANDIWMPAGACPFRSAPAMMNDRAMRMVGMFAVMKPGVSLQRASNEIGTITQRLRQAYPEAYPASAELETPRLVSLADELTQSSRPLLLTLVAASAFLLIIAATNFANLSVARQLRRGREMALRAALGAGRTRLFRQLVTESFCVTIAGGAVGVLIAYNAMGLLRTLATYVSPRGDEISLDTTVLAFALASSVVVGLLAALAPLYGHREASLNDDLRASGAATTGARSDSRTRDILVGVQVAVAFVLLAGAGLMVRSLVRLQRVDGGYDASHVMTARVVLDWTRYTATKPDAARNFSEQLVAELESQPGVVAAAVSTDFPLNNGQPSSQPFQIRENANARSGTSPHSDISLVGPRYFKAIGIPLIAGREFTAADRDTANIPAIIGKRLADTYWPRMPAIGQQLTVDNGAHWLTIVGIAGDVRQNNLSQNGTDEIYIPIAASPVTDMRVLVRTAGEPSFMGPRIVAAVHAIDPREPVVSIQTLEALRGIRLAEPRTTAVLLVSFAILALVITAAGLAGVIGYSVNQRVAEIGVRVALGASSPSIVWLIVRRGLLLATVGLVAGVATALGATRLMASLLYSTPTTDLFTFFAVAAWLMVIATLACVIPARRALRIDPVLALRSR